MSGYQDRNGLWHTDERTDEERRADAVVAVIVMLMVAFAVLTASVFVVLGVFG